MLCTNETNNLQDYYLLLEEIRINIINKQLTISDIQNARIICDWFGYKDVPDWLKIIANGNEEIIQLLVIND